MNRYPFSAAYYNYMQRRWCLAASRSGLAAQYNNFDSHQTEVSNRRSAHLIKPFTFISFIFLGDIVWSSSSEAEERKESVRVKFLMISL